MLPWGFPFQGIPVTALFGISPKLLSLALHSISRNKSSTGDPEYRSTITWPHPQPTQGRHGQDNPHRALVPATIPTVQARLIPGYRFASRRAAIAGRRPAIFGINLRFTGVARDCLGTEHLRPSRRNQTLTHKSAEATAIFYAQRVRLNLRERQRP